MTKRREDQLTVAYRMLHVRLSEILYNEDPDGMGSTAGAPDDEYSPEVSRLIPQLQRVHDRGQVAMVVRDMYPAATDVLIDQVAHAWTQFLEETRSGPPPQT